MAARTDLATYGLAVLVVGTFLVPCLSAPVREDDALPANPWWHNACAPHTRHNDLAKLRAPPNCSDPDPRTLKYVRAPVKRQITHFKNFYRRKMGDMTKLYQAPVQVTAMDNKSLLFKWLPGPESFKSNMSVGKALIQMHEDLQQYAVAIHKLKQIEVRTNVQFKHNDRKRALDSIEVNLRLLLCEIETAANLTCQQLPARISPSDRPDDITKQSDLTVLIPQEWSVLTRLSKFVRGTHRAFKQLLASGNERPTDDEDGAASDSSAAESSDERR